MRTDIWQNLKQRGGLESPGRQWPVFKCALCFLAQNRVEL